MTTGLRRGPNWTWHRFGISSPRMTPIAADGFIAELLVVFRKLQDFPRMGTARPDLGAGLRLHPHGKYVIIHRMHYEIVEITRVIHGARHLRKALSEGD